MTEIITAESLIHTTYIACGTDSRLEQDNEGAWVLTWGTHRIAVGEEWDRGEDVDTLWGYSWATYELLADPDDWEIVDQDGSQDPEDVRATLAAWLTEAVLDALNSYKGDNIWQDVIYGIVTSDEWDAAVDGADAFEHAGVTYRYEPSYQRWIAA